MPDSYFIIFWNGCFLFLLLMNTLIIPLNLCFSETRNQVASNISALLEEFTIFFILTDIILSLFTAYYSKGAIITNKSKIIKNYFSYSFFLDFLNILPYFIASLIPSSYVSIIAMFRLFKMKTIFHELEEHLFFQGKLKEYMSYLN